MARSGGICAGAGWKNPAASGCPGLARADSALPFGSCRLQSVEIEHFAIRINRWNTVFVGLDLDVGERVETLLHRNQRVAKCGPARRAIAGQGVQHAPVIIHVFTARLAVSIARECHVATIGEQSQQLVPKILIFQLVERPRPQPGALERDQIHVVIAAFGERAALRLCQPRQPFILHSATGNRGTDLLAACGYAAFRRA